VLAVNAPSSPSPAAELLVQADQQYKTPYKKQFRVL